DLAGDLEADAGREVGLDGAGDDIDRGPLRRHDDVDAGGSRVARVHGPFVSDLEVEKVVDFLRAQGEPAYIEEVTEAEEDLEGGDSGLSGIAAAGEGEKGLFDQAVSLVSREGKASTSFIQRHLNIGYNRAAKLIEQMEKEGVVGPANHVGKREVLTRRPDEDD
ncbi:MAG: hypothetical protein EON47_17470, partial [Acetobacteraceae bacterium]